LLEAACKVCSSTFFSKKEALLWPWLPYILAAGFAGDANGECSYGLAIMDSDWSLEAHSPHPLLIIPPA
jgi:hypothetical protein